MQDKHRYSKKNFYLCKHIHLGQTGFDSRSRWSASMRCAWKWAP